MDPTFRLMVVLAVAVACTPAEVREGGPGLHRVGGTVEGLSGAGLVLQNAGSDELRVDAAGPFQFATALPASTAYDVEVKTHPVSPSQTCTVSGGTGVVGTADVTTVRVTCATDPRPRVVGGTVTGLVGTGLVLQNNGADDLSVLADGAFTFTAAMLEGERYAVSVRSQPDSPPQRCAVALGSGVVGAEDVSSVAVTCTAAKLFFAAWDDTPLGDQLWVWDGAAATQIIGPSGPFLGSSPDGFTVWNGAVYYAANGLDSTHALWRSDGTSAGTAIVKEVLVAEEGVLWEQDPLWSHGPTKGWLAPFDGALWFSGRDAWPNDELWKTDGTAEGTVLVKDINTSGSEPSNPWGFTVLGRELLFCASDGVHGVELWKTDGTTEGTVLVKDINPGAGGSCVPYRVPTAFRGRMYFQATDGVHGSELWATDGTAAGTVMVKDVNPGAGDGLGDRWSAWDLVAMGGVLFFQAADGSAGAELWRTDGTAEGTVQVKDISPGASGSAPHELTVVAGTLYFAAGDATFGQEVWRSDGSEAGTVRVTDVCNGACTSGIGDLAAYRGELVFVATDGWLGRELWKTDGTAAGTAMLKDIMVGASTSSPYEFTEFGGFLYFGASDGSNLGQYGFELWRTDGTPEGTVRLTDLAPGYDSSSPSGFFVL
jgi:ELWxxDGT repeat protein